MYHQQCFYNDNVNAGTYVVNKEQGTLVCHYCEKEQDINKVELI